MNAAWAFTREGCSRQSVLTRTWSQTAAGRLCIQHVGTSTLPMEIFEGLRVPDPKGGPA